MGVAHLIVVQNRTVFFKACLAGTVSTLVDGEELNYILLSLALQGEVAGVSLRRGIESHTNSASPGKERWQAVSLTERN